MSVAAHTLTRPLCVQLERGLLLADLGAEARLRRWRRSATAWLGADRSATLREPREPRDAREPPGAPGPGVDTLPLDRKLLERLRQEHSRGRSLWLCTLEDEALAQRLAEHLKLFDGVIAGAAADADASSERAAPLIARFGPDGWESLAAARGRSPSASALWRLMRPHQWAKNILLGVPLLAAHRAFDPGALLAVLGSALAFCLCASSVYVLNDMLDLDSDRAHPRKSKRPLAAGEVSIGTGSVLVVVLLALAAALACLLPPKFQLALATYYGLTLLYSVVLKGVVIVDALALAGLYTLRIIAGATAASVPLSFWLLLFSIFLFLSLAFVKRYAELDALRRRFKLSAEGRGYHVDDLPVLQTLGSGAGYLSVLVLALYINSPEVAALYHRPKFIWLLCVLMLYWVSRIWMKTHRGAMHDDPVVFALTDRTSLLVGVAAAASVALAV